MFTNGLRVANIARLIPNLRSLTSLMQYKGDTNAVLYLQVPSGLISPGIGADLVGTMKNRLAARIPSMRSYRLR